MVSIHRIQREGLALLHRYLLSGIRVLKVHCALENNDVERILVRAGHAKTSGVVENQRACADSNGELIVMLTRNVELSFSLIQIDGCEGAAGRIAAKFCERQLR
jgi:hypothetical protein